MNSDAAEDDEPIDPAVTQELFLTWRSPRFGGLNPEVMSNPVWQWLVKSKINAYQATQRLNGPSAFDAGPCWCFDRFGQSSNQLPDGRFVFIAGEHEDYYDPDFYIYNDVVVQHPDGGIDIFGYPREVFPPTDFHSATLVSDRIILIGKLGYQDERRPESTPVMILDLKTFAISEVQASGAPPGWIHGHNATLSENGHSILVQGGQLDPGENRSLVENIDDWRLHLDEWRWERLTERQWPRYEVRRKDAQRNHLFEYQQAVWAKLFSKMRGGVNSLPKSIFEVPSLQEELGKAPELDLFERLYKPSVQHEEVADSNNEFRVHRIKVAGVIVRYVEESDSIRLTVEGDLSPAILDALVTDLVGKLSSLENSICESVQL